MNNPIYNNCSNYKLHTHVTCQAGMHMKNNHLQLPQLSHVSIVTPNVAGHMHKLYLLYNTYEKRKMLILVYKEF